MALFILSRRQHGLKSRRGRLFRLGFSGSTTETLEGFRFSPPEWTEHVPGLERDYELMRNYGSECGCGNWSIDLESFVMKGRWLGTLGVLAGLCIAPGSAKAEVCPAGKCPVADYQFQNSRSSSVPGAPDLSDVSDNSVPNTFMADTVDGTPQTVLAFPNQNGLSLGVSGLIPDSETYTIVLLVSLDAVSGFRKYMDFKSRTADIGLYETVGSLQLYPHTDGISLPIIAGRYMQIVLTRNGLTSTAVGYVDGVQQFLVTDTSPSSGQISAGQLFFFLDDFACCGDGESSSGKVARLRIWNTVLSDGEVAALDREPAPVASTAAPATSAWGSVVLMTLLAATGIWRNRVRVSPKH